MTSLPEMCSVCNKHSTFNQLFLTHCYTIFQRIRDAQLVGLVLIMNAVIVLIVIIWESIGPQIVVVKEMTKDVS